MIVKNIAVNGTLLIAVALFSRVNPLMAQGDQTDQNNGYAGSQACIECHKDQSLSGPHAASKNPDSPAAQHSCETCHGPGLRHAKFQEDGEEGVEEDPTLESLRIGDKSSASVQQRNAMCIECHNGAGQALWDGSVHERRDVSCSDCHTLHSKNPKYLRTATEAELCSSCHKDVKAELQRDSHHPIREGKMQCSDCHNSHGTVADKLISANNINDKCFECHAEKRGPFLWDHAPVQENCMNCHTAHGSNHGNLLTQKISFLCQSCHSEASHPGTMNSIPNGSANKNAFVMLNNRAFNKACLNCHSAVHGSNSPSGSTLGR